jgi:hypothetical protein
MRAMKTIFMALLLLFSVRAFATDGNRLSEICSVAEKQEFQPDELRKLAGMHKLYRWSLRYSDDVAISYRE